MGLLFSRRGITIYQSDINVVRNAKMLLELPFRKKLNGTFRLSLFGPRTFPATLLAFNSRMDGDNIPSY